MLLDISLVNTFSLIFAKEKTTHKENNAELYHSVTRWNQ